MKRTLSVLLIFIFTVSFLLAYHQGYRTELEQMERAGEGDSTPFRIPNYASFASPTEMYPILLDAAVKAKVNIFRTNIDYGVDDEVRIHKYVLLTSSTAFFDSFRLKSGRFLTVQDTQQGNSYLSTVDSEDQEQSGTIKMFGSHRLIEIKPLRSAYKHLPVEGQYFIEGTDEQYQQFVDHVINKIVANKLVDQGNRFTPEDFKGHFYTSGKIEIEADFFTYIRYLIFLVTIIMLVYYVFNESKQIGVMKMHGLSNLHLWYLVIGRLVTVIYIWAAVISVLAALLMKDTASHFIVNVILSQLVSYVIALLISLIAYVYIARTKVIDVIKNRKETNGIVTLNTMLKTGCSIFLVLVILPIWNQFDEVRIQEENLKSWERSKDYGVFYPVRVGDDSEDYDRGAYKITATEVTGLYPLLNKMGALFIDARSYRESVLLLNRDSRNIRSISVNLNYLQEFPVYDAQGNPVNISEDTSDFILLVPEKYRNKEKEILDYFTKVRKNLVEVDEYRFQVEVPDRVRNQRLSIIWTANNQIIFSFNPEVFPSENNMIVDPIIRVLTEKNSLVADKANIMSGGGGRDPLKVKLINRDSERTFELLEPELKRLKLDDNLTNLISVDQFVLSQIYELKNTRTQLTFISLGLLAGLLVLVVQNLSVFFSKFQRRFIVRRLFGTGFFKTYQEYMWLLSVTWAIQIGACLLVNSGFASSLLQMAGSVSMVASSINEAVGSSSDRLLAIGAGVLAIEFIASVFALFVIERKNKGNVLKGGGEAA